MNGSNTYKRLAVNRFALKLVRLVPLVALSCVVYGATGILIQGDTWYFLLVTIAGILGAIVELVRSRRVTPDDIQELREEISQLGLALAEQRGDVRGAIESIIASKASIEDWQDLASRVAVSERLVDKVIDEWKERSASESECCDCADQDDGDGD